MNHFADLNPEMDTGGNDIENGGCSDSSEIIQSNYAAGSSTSEGEFAGLENHIKPIDKNVVHRICSGQVVVTLATAVKELVENSIDAGATSIDVRLIESGSKCVEVSDNGLGVPEVDFEGLGLKHHTSKIQEFEDLTYVETFGFRGEALSSLCALSDLTVITKSKPKKKPAGGSDKVLGIDNADADCTSSVVTQAFRIEYDRKGRIKQKSHCAREFGTTVILKNLFSTLPVRHNEFMKNLKKEFSKMIHILYGYCLVSTGVRISCTNQIESGTVSKILSVPVSNTVREKIVSLFGSKLMETLMEIEEAGICDNENILEEFGLTKDVTEQGNPFKFSGFISLPYKGRSSTDRQFLFINSRPCESTKISRIINGVYHGYSKSSRYPFVYLHIRTEQENVDVNITPDKRQIYLRNEKVLYATIKTTLTSLLSNATSSFSSQGMCQDIRTFSQSSHRSVSSDPGEDSSLVASQPDNFDSNSDEESISDVKKDRQNQMEEPDVMILQVQSTQPRSSIDTRVKSNNENPKSLRDYFKQFEYKNKSLLGKTKEGTASSHSVHCVRSPKFNARRCITEKFSRTNTASIKRSRVEYNDDDDDDDEEEDDVMEVDCQPDRHIFSQQTKVDMTRQDSLDRTLQASTSAHTSRSHEVEGTPDVKTIVLEPTSVSDTPCSFQVYGNAKVVSIRVNWDNVKKKNIDRFNNVEESHGNVGRNFKARISAEDNKTAEDELRKQITKDMFKKMQIIGQFNHGFIIVKYGPDLFIIDQHATDEKYNYEELEKNLTLQSQVLIRPVDLQLPATSALTLIDKIDVFRKNGFDFAINEEDECIRKVKMVKIPYSHQYEFGKDDVDELIFVLGEAPDNSFYRPRKVRDMLASRACKKAVKIGDVLNTKEMRNIVDHMGLMEQPWNCPHGRPTIRHLLNLNMMPTIELYSANH